MSYVLITLAAINVLICLYFVVKDVKVNAWSAAAMAFCWLLAEIQRLGYK